MNKMMTAAEIDAASVPLSSFMDDRFAAFPTAPRVKHEGPFSKRAEGRARRAERRARQVERNYWLNS